MGIGVSFLGVKRPERGVNHPPPFSARAVPLLPLWAFVQLRQSQDGIRTVRQSTVTLTVHSPLTVTFTFHRRAEKLKV